MSESKEYIAGGMTTWCGSTPRIHMKVCSEESCCSREELRKALTEKDKQIAEAVHAERQRCRKEEVKPLMDILPDISSVLEAECYQDDVDNIEKAITAVELVQKEKP